MALRVALRSPGVAPDDKRRTSSMVAASVIVEAAHRVGQLLSEDRVSDALGGGKRLIDLVELVMELIKS
eukprot:1146322-Pleurochrysis_carterae.AAC.1